MDDVSIDSVRDFGLDQAPDPDLLRFALDEGFIFMTHDARTVPGFLHKMIRAGEDVPRVVVVPEAMPVGDVVRELVVLFRPGRETDWQASPLRLPL